MATLSSKVTPSGVATATQGTLADSAVQPNDSPTFNDLTATGEITTDGNLVLGTTGNSVIRQDLTDKILTISGGSGNTVGANVRLYGEAHGSNPNNVVFRAATSTELKYDDTASSWDFQANAVITTGTVTATSFAGDGSSLTGISTSTNYGAVGTYGFFYRENAGQKAPATTTAGSSLLPANTWDYSTAGYSGSYSGSGSPSGTWRLMGQTGYYNKTLALSRDDMYTSLYVRIS